MNVLLFARARDIYGAGFVALERPLPDTVGELRARLAIAAPALTGLLKVSKIAVDGTIAEDDASIPIDGEIAMLPPVSGG